MRRYPLGTFFIFIILFSLPSFLHAQGFVKRAGQQLVLNGKPLYYIGTNYWYGSLLGLEKDKTKGVERLRSELDFLKAQGITNLRVMAAAEGEGKINGVERVGPAYQPEKGQFNDSVLVGLDILLYEMSRRNMKAVIFFSNNWEWSGGFQQYLQWSGLLEDSLMRNKQSWDEMRDYTSRFYSCSACTTAYLDQVARILNRRNSISGVLFREDPVIMAWELANEPRPMRPSAIAAYRSWVAATAAFIKSKDKNHLVTTGVEGWIGTEGIALFDSIHNDPNIDYLTIHIWPRNWGWYQAGAIEQELPSVIQKTLDYIREHLQVAARLNKPLVVEEFGMPRDDLAFAPGTATTIRDTYYKSVFGVWKKEKKRGGAFAGLNFWSFSGQARPVEGQPFWKKGDAYMGDPPMEEQGLYGVYDLDLTTWKLIRKYSKPKN